VRNRPSPNQSTRRPRPDVTRDDFPVEVTPGLSALMLRVEMGRLVLLIEHPNHDSEERRDDRHVLVPGARAWVFIARLASNIHPTGSACNAPARRAGVSESIREKAFDDGLERIRGRVASAGPAGAYFRCPFFRCAQTRARQPGARKRKEEGKAKGQQWGSQLESAMAGADRLS
jgi:hypothetical protein